MSTCLEQEAQRYMKSVILAIFYKSISQFKIYFEV